MAKAPTATPALDSNALFAQRSELVLALALLGILVVLLVPLPTLVLDLLLALNLACTILLLLVTLSATQPLDFSVFPSVLLLMTLFRLSLNVATTRLILLRGNAGLIVSTFGGFVVGGNLVVGLVIFLILIIIQFVVITKGAGRISEVSARFTLDAMPGKQMAIDAELNAGAIDEPTARSRRQHLMREAEFYGAMDGASKFVRGDAIAGLIITAINLVGGVVLGLLRHMPITQALHTYSTLTVGDGLVSQIPALIVATASGMLVTKATTQSSLGQEISEQVTLNSRPLIVGAVIVLALALVPGLQQAWFAFVPLAIVLFIAGRRLAARQARSAAPAEGQPGAATAAGAAGAAPKPAEIPLDDFLQVDR
ncbi:MAG TPA: flagellar biosynthesis protein FlhA, partial [Gemmataceae bacterium]|nr:flagellar biosynthesis protein FlhA [Gemmataceae bacterium]